MTQDWLLTLLVISPALITAVITVLAVTRRLAQNEHAHRTADVLAFDGADQTEEMKSIPS
jgi:hypothetical protein